jgi:apolipoprotein N-acyltransferase
MSPLPFEVRGAFVLNITLLFCVAIEPYLFYVLDQSAIGLLDFASSIYALDTGAMMFLLAGLVYMVRHAKRDSLPHGVSSAEIFSGTVFFASALPLFWLPVQFGSFLRFDLWYGSFIVFFGIIRVPLGRKSPE